jgi:predicted acylesterase/phospholipase RssA
VPVGDALLVDGGVLNNLPIDIARTQAPVGRVFAFDVAPPRGPGAHGDYGLAVSGWKALRARTGRERSPYPGISAVLMRSMITASMQERDRQVGNGLADFYLNLDMRGVSMLDFSDPVSVATRGYEAAMPALEALLETSEWQRLL